MPEIPFPCGTAFCGGACPQEACCTRKAPSSPTAALKAPRPTQNLGPVRRAGFPESAAAGRLKSGGDHSPPPHEDDQQPQPQLLSQPQPQPLPLVRLVPLPQPQQENRRIRMMIHQQLLKPLLHIFMSLHNND